MTETIKSPLIFFSGVAVGSVVTWLCVRGHYRTEKEEEIASVKEVYEKRFSNEPSEEEKVSIAKNKPDISIYTQALEEARARSQYSNIEPEDDDDDEEPEQEEIRPDPEEVKQEFSKSTSNLYEITPSEFASFSNDRTRITVTRFADDVFADEMYNQIDPMDYLSGDLVPLTDSKPVRCLDYIRRMPQDEICIRNFDLGIDIDIVTEARTYSDYMST